MSEIVFSGVDANQALQYSYDSDAQGLRITGAGTLVTEAFDYISATYPIATTEVYVYKTGGSSGTTVATVTVVYTDSSKTNISTVTKA